MRALYPPIEPYATERLAVDGRHTLYVEQCGRPDGLPALFLHGGPGSGLAPYHRQFFDPARYRVVLFEQRGAGRSTPHADLVDNTTAHLVADIETLREHLGIERWVVFGGSWGSTLALAYAQAHPQRVLGLVLRGIFLGRPDELTWFNEVGGGAARIFPERWERFRDFIPEAERGSMLEAYWRRLDSDDKDTRLAAAMHWSAWEGGCVSLEHNPDDAGMFDDAATALAVSRIEAHYFRHDLFLAPDQLLDGIDRIRHLPCTIVHGRYDIICPMASAWDLARAWPQAKLEVVLAGHSAADPAIRDRLVAATDRLADRYV